MARTHTQALVSGLFMLGAGVTGCVSLTPGDIASAVTPIDGALATPPSILRTRAEAGNAQAQYALAIVFAHGLQGIGRDPELARSWRGKALARRGFTPITQYIAGYKGHPGRVITTGIPRYDMAPAQASLVEGCIGLLAGRSTGSDLNLALDRGACGGRANYDRLAALWARSTLPAPHATV